MTKEELLNKLNKENIPTEVVNFDNPIKDGLCIRKVYYRWEVFFRERGKEYDDIGFSNESDALQYIYEKLVSLYNR